MQSQSLGATNLNINTSEVARLSCSYEEQIILYCFKLMHLLIGRPFDKKFIVIPHGPGSVNNVIIKPPTREITRSSSKNTKLYRKKNNLA